MRNKHVNAAAVLLAGAFLAAHSVSVPAYGGSTDLYEAFDDFEDADDYDFGDGGESDGFLPSGESVLFAKDGSSVLAGIEEDDDGNSFISYLVAVSAPARTAGRDVPVAVGDSEEKAEESHFASGGTKSGRIPYDGGDGVRRVLYMTGSMKDGLVSFVLCENGKVSALACVSDSPEPRLREDSSGVFGIGVGDGGSPIFCGSPADEPERNGWTSESGFDAGSSFLNALEVCADAASSMTPETLSDAVQGGYDVEKDGMKAFVRIRNGVVIEVESSLDGARLTGGLPEFRVGQNAESFEEKAVEEGLELLAENGFAMDGRFGGQPVSIWGNDSVSVMVAGEGDDSRVCSVSCGGINAESEEGILFPTSGEAVFVGESRNELEERGWVFSETKTPLE